MSKSSSERKSAERERRKAAGLVRVEVWARPENKQKIIDLANELESNMPHLKATHYEVTGKEKNWTATVFDGSNIITEIEAVSEKQAHFLAHQEYPEAKNPIETDKEWSKQYNSAESKSWRKMNKTKIN